MHNDTSKTRKKFVPQQLKFFIEFLFISKGKLLMTCLVLHISGNFRPVKHNFLLQSPQH